MLKDVCLVFDYGCGLTCPAPVTGLAASPLQILNTIQSLELRIDNQSVFNHENSHPGTITQAYVDYVLAHTSVDLTWGTPCFEMFRGFVNSNTQASQPLDPFRK